MVTVSVIVGAKRGARSSNRRTRPFVRTYTGIWRDLPPVEVPRVVPDLDENTIAI